MTKPSETLWKIERHTKAKHEILERYLGAWFPILGSKIPRIVYIDGFCGPGRYIDGEAGSPIIALNAALKQSALAMSEVNFIFIDERADRIQHLEDEISLLKVPSNFHIHPIVNEFENTLTQLLDNLQQKGHQLAPTFAFIDPFGFTGTPFSLVKRLLSNPRTEVFINIMIEFVNRFAEHPSTNVQQNIKQLLGASDVEIHNIVNSPDRVLAFRQLYQDKLHKHAKFVRFFEMYDDKNNLIYYLFFAGNHPLGHKKMKEAFWRVDGQNGFKFSDRTDPNQPVLFELDPSIDLAKLLKLGFSGTIQKSETIIMFVEDETPYTETHTKKALSYLESTNEISVEHLKSDGKTRRKGTFPEGVIIHF